MAIKLNTGIICAALILASCGGGSTGGGSTGATTAPTVTANTGTITITTAATNIVSIGASGTNFKTADAQGKAVFTGLAPGAVDVHIFSADGYSASSYYGINSDTIIDNFGLSFSAGFSVIDVYVSVVNADMNGQAYFLNDGNDTNWGFRDPATGITTFQIFQPVGTTISATIYAGQGSATSTAGNPVMGFAEMLNLGTSSLTTTAISGVAQAGFTATFATTPPTPPTLVILNSVTPPTDTTVFHMEFAGITIMGMGGMPPTLPDTIAAAVPNDNTWRVMSSNMANTKQWYKGGTFTVGATMNINATLSLYPTVAANQTGSTISWVNPAGSWQANSIFITGNNIYWDIYTPSTTSSITLPTMPIGMASPLAMGSVYAMETDNISSSLSYEQVFSATDLNGINFETVSVSSSYTR